VPFGPAVTSSAGATRLVVVVGPEGGVSDAEIEALTDAGARAVVLAPEVLRTSTAATVALAALGVLTTRWSDRPTTLEPSAPSPGKGSTSAPQRTRQTTPRPRTPRRRAPPSNWIRTWPWRCSAPPTPTCGPSRGCSPRTCTCAAAP